MKKDSNFFKKIKKILKKILNNKKLSLKKINFSKDLDSLEMLNFVNALEKSFKLKFTDSDLNYKNFSSLEKLQKLITKNVYYKKKK